MTDDRDMTLADFHPDSFAPHLESAFALENAAPAAPADLVLAEVQPFETRSYGARSDPFGLVFLGPPAPILEQRIHRLRHPVLGEMELFLVPIGPARDGRQRYEAIFN